MDYCQPGLIPDHASLDPEKRLENVKRAMDLAEQHLNIPQVMHPEDLAVDKPDKLSSMTYLSQFCCPNSVGEKTLLDFIRKKLPHLNITNFTTDWVDGRVLGALTAAVCPYDPQTNDSNPTDRCKAAMTAAEVNLFARKIVQTSEFINPDLDSRLRMAYLVEIYHATQPPRILETHIPERAGAGQEIVVDLEVPQQGSIEASAFGTVTGPTSVVIEGTTADHSQVKIAVPVRDEYTVSITHSGRVIRGCPFVIALDSYSVQHIETSMPRKIGDACCLTYDTSQIDGKPIEAKVTGKASGELELKMDNSTSDRCLLSFIPLHLDTYTVTISVEGKAVKESPFVLPLLHMVEPQKVMCGEVVLSGVGSPVSIAIDCKKAGKGALTASCTGKSSGDVPVHIITTDDTPSAITFTPNSEDLYLLQVLYEGEGIPGSPWCIDLRDLPPEPGLVRVLETPSGSLQVGKELNVVFDTSDAGSGQLTASCNGTVCGNVLVSIVTVEFGKYRVGFIPMKPDNYFVSVFWASVMVPGAPFQISFGCQPVIASKCRLVGLTGNANLVKIRKVYQGLIGREIVLHVKTGGAGAGKLEVKIQAPSEKIVIVAQSSSDDPDTQIVRYSPHCVGHYQLHLLWGGNVVPGTPIGFDVVSPLSFPLGGPVTVELDLDGKKKDLNGEAVLQREGLPEKIKATVNKSNNKKVILSLDPRDMEPGTYVLHVYSKYKELPNSPVLLVYGQEEANVDETANEGVAATAASGVASEAGLLHNSSQSHIPFPSPATESAAPKKSGELGDDVDSPPQVVETSPKPEDGTPEDSLPDAAEVRKKTVSTEEAVSAVSEKVAEATSVLDTESDPPLVEVSKQPEDVGIEGLKLLETLAPTESGISPSSSTHSLPRDRSHTHDITRDRSHTPDMPPRSHSFEISRPEVMITTPSGSIYGEERVNIPLDEERVNTPQGRATSSQSGDMTKSATTSPEVPPLSQATPSHDTSPQPSAPPLQEAAALPEIQPATEQAVDELGVLPIDTAAVGAGEQQIEATEIDMRDEKEKKGKKKAKAKSKKEIEKAEKAEKAKKEKDEKKKKKERKEGGLNLEDQEFRVGIKMKYKLHCEDLGTKAPDIICDPPEAAKYSVIQAPQFGDNTYWCEITPTQVGEMAVSIIYEDFHILGSPFSVKVGPRGDALQCHMVETSSTCERQLENSILFCIAVPESAGRGKLIAAVRSAATNKHLHGIRTTAMSKQHYHVEFNPTEGLEYILSVKYDEHHIVGSPFLINLGDPAKCKVHGDGIKQAHTREENTFIVDGTDAGPGELAVTIKGEEKTIDPKITVTGEKEYRISYTTQKPGQYHVAVLWGDGHVTNSPFQVPCIDASQFSITDSVHQAYAGGVASIQVVTTAPLIRHKQLSVFAHPKTDISKMFSGEIIQAGKSVFTCSLHPTEAHIGLCNVHICWNGKEIEGSPYELCVADPPSPGDFTLEAAEDASGDIAIHVNGSTDVFATETVVATVDNIFTGEKVPATVTKLSNEKCCIQLMPTMGGEYQLSILYAGTHIADSPFVLTQADPSQCQISGDGLKVSKVDALSKFTVDHSMAGLGHLRVDIDGEDGSTIEPFIAAGESLSEVSYVSKCAGVFRITTHWGEHELPGSPFTMYSIDPLKFSLKEPLPKCSPVGEPLQFFIQTNGPVAEWGQRLSVTAKLIHQQQVYKGAVEAEQSRNELQYHCALNIPETGHYAVYVQCRGIDIQGSPFTIRMMPPPKPDRVRVSGTGLKTGTVGQKSQFTIDGREAGYGHIGLKVQGPGGGLSINLHHHKSLDNVTIAEYSPVYPGKYTIHLMWAGLVVPGSPYSVSIHGRRKGEDGDSGDGKWVSYM